MNSKSWGTLIIKYFNMKIRGKRREERKQTAHVGGNVVKKKYHSLFVGMFSGSFMDSRMKSSPKK